MTRPSHSLLFASVFLLATAGAIRADNLLENPSFENGLAPWTATPADAKVFTVVPEAASMGKTGLRILGESPAHLLSPKFPAVAGHIYRFSCWTRPNAGRAPMISLVFLDAAGKALTPAPYPGFWPATVPKDFGQFNNTTLQAIAPEGAVSVGVDIQAYKSNAGSTDIDDCMFADVPAELAKRGTPQATDVDALFAEIKADPTRGQTPPKIVLKLDDFGLAGINKGPDKLQGPDQSWKRIEKFATERKIKVGIGIVPKCLETCGPGFIEWIKKMHDSGLVEFWFHGYDHAGWKDAEGKIHSEFVVRTLAEQSLEFSKGQKLMQEKVGFPMVSFGPPGGVPDGGFDVTTCQAMQDDPFMTVWLYNKPMDQAGLDLQAKGKVRVLERVWPVNLESVVGHANFASFLTGYAHNRGRAYFVLQGHPPLWGWGNDRFDEFFKIVDFLESQGAVFTTPTECAAAIAGIKSPAPVATTPTASAEHASN